MNTSEIFHPIREGVAYVRNLVGGAYGDTPLLTREEVGVPTTTSRTLPQLSIEDLFEASLGELVFGRSLLSDPITHAPLGMLDILRALQFQPEIIEKVSRYVHSRMATLHQSLMTTYGPSAFVTFWISNPAYLTIRVITAHECATSLQQPVGAL